MVAWADGIGPRGWKGGRLKGGRARAGERAGPRAGARRIAGAEGRQVGGEAAGRAGGLGRVGRRTGPMDFSASPRLIVMVFY